LDGIEVMGTPIIRPRKTPCYLCMKCPPVCPSGALKRTLRKKEEVRMGTAVIDTKACLAWQGILCRSCFDDCPIYDEAIKMDEKLQPVVAKDKCVGCGICENVCPVDPAAIVIQPGGKG
jgi:ferredoxin